MSLPRIFITYFVMVFSFFLAAMAADWAAKVLFDVSFWKLPVAVIVVLISSIGLLYSQYMVISDRNYDILELKRKSFYAEKEIEENIRIQKILADKNTSLEKLLDIATTPSTPTTVTATTETAAVTEPATPVVPEPLQPVVFVVNSEGHPVYCGSKDVAEKMQFRDSKLSMVEGTPSANPCATDLPWSIFAAGKGPNPILAQLPSKWSAEGWVSANPNGTYSMSCHLPWCAL